MASNDATLWELSIRTRPESPDPEFERLRGELDSLAPYVQQRFSMPIPSFTVERGYLLEGSFHHHDVMRIAEELLADPVLETASACLVDHQKLNSNDVTILRKPGVMDPTAESALRTIRQLGLNVAQVRTFRRYRLPEDSAREVTALLAEKLFANEAIEQIVYGNLSAEHLSAGAEYEFCRITVPIRGMNDDALEKLSRDGQLYLELDEMRAIRDHFEHLGRNPTDVELETLAQTWSEHCCHKTLLGPYEFNGERSDNGLLRDTIVYATRTLNRDWCVSVFEDNAGVIRFDDENNVCFKVETHNHPSAIEPYGGANTGLGGCVRDPLGTGLGAKPICSTDVFCVAPPDTPYEDLPAGVLHPARVLRGVVAGVRDYGNRMGIPTVNGAVYFDERYLGNPLVYCGVVGLLPADKSFGHAKPGDLIVAVGGRTGRDGIHGATFSSGELTTESETVSGGAVQIGNPIMEKKLVDVLLQARDQGLYNAITDCGAGGFSSAVGEMGEKIGAQVHLESAPLKYQGLSYTEIWISEAQERMVLAVPPEKWEALRSLAASEDVEAVILGRFESTGRLQLTYKDQEVCDLSMQFLHKGRPQSLRRGEWSPPTSQPHRMPEKTPQPGQVLRQILGSYNVASKEWIIRQYDHEVQGGSVVKPLVGVTQDGPSDAAVVTPVLGSSKGIAVACGLNPHYGTTDPYRMAASAIDEAIRNVVAVGGDPDRTALLDNFCWGNTSRPEVFGSLCQAAFACRDLALAYRTPFISGKDSLNNEFNTGSERIVIPPTLLISAIAIVPDVAHARTMDLKKQGNKLVLVGLTRDELGGSHLNLVTGATGGEIPTVDPKLGNRVFAGVYRAICAGQVAACHDLSEGGLAVSAAEMAFAGGLGAKIHLDKVPADGDLDIWRLLFSESNSRLLLEIEPEHADDLSNHLEGTPHAIIGDVTQEPVLTITDKAGNTVLSENIHELKQAWQKPLAW